jgi:hypothetical protein
MKVRFVKSQDEKNPNSGTPTLHGDDPNKSTVEAEKGETVLTTSGNAGNQKELAYIGGRTHEDGGTFLDLPPGSAIFSDHLKLKDPKMLELFGYTGKKPKTFAEISKQYKLSELNNKLKDPDANTDKIAKRSLEKSIKNASFKLSLLFTLQQFHEEKKGEQQEHSRHFEPFLERTRMGYDELLNSDNLEEAPTDRTEEIPMKNGGLYPYGGIVNPIDFSPLSEELPKFNDGGVNKAKPKREAPKYDESNAFTKEGVNWLNTFLPDYGISGIDTSKEWSKDQVLERVSQAQVKAIEQNPDLVFDFMAEGDDYQKSHRPNEKLQGTMKEAVKAGRSSVKPTGPNGSFSNADLKQMLAERKSDSAKGLAATDVLSAYNDNKWWYRMVTSKVKKVTQDEYNKLLPILEKEGVSQGNKKYLYKGNGVYEAYLVDADGNVTEVEPDPKDLEKLYKWDIKNLPDQAPVPDDMRYRWENRRALAQAKKNRRNIPFITPFTPLPETYYTDSAYYNPDQAINAFQSMAATRGEQQAMFASPQSQLANQLADQEYSKMNSVISEYADKNVAAYNNERNMNTNIAQQASNRLSSALKGNANEWATLKQQYRTAATNADNAIAMQEIAMHKERADRLNMEDAIGEQFRTDPNTGRQRFVRGKDFSPDTTKTAGISDTYTTLRTELPNASDEIIAKMALAMHSDKMKVSAAGSTEYDPNNYSG